MKSRFTIAVSSITITGNNIFNTVHACQFVFVFLFVYLPFLIYFLHNVDFALSLIFTRHFGTLGVNNYIFTIHTVLRYAEQTHRKQELLYVCL